MSRYLGLFFKKNVSQKQVSTLLLVMVVFFTLVGYWLIEHLQTCVLIEKYDTKMDNDRINHQRLVHDELKNLTGFEQFIKTDPQGNSLPQSEDWPGLDHYLGNTLFYILLFGFGMLGLAVFGLVLFRQSRRAAIAHLRALSAQKRQAQELLLKHELAEEQYALAFWEYDIRNNSILVSEVGLNVLGHDGHSPQWRSLQEWQAGIHPQEQSKISKHFRALLMGRTERFFAVHRYWHAKGYYIWLEVRALVFERDAKGRVLVTLGLFKDVTHEVTQHSEMLSGRQEAEKANYEKSLFLANMSHEIRTPLNGLIGLTDLALRTQLTDQQRSYLEQALHASQSLLAIINEILDYSKIDAGKLEIVPRKFEWPQLLISSVGLFRSAMEDKQLRFSVSVDPRLRGPLQGDDQRLTQVVNNLLSNAIKFTDEGEIRLSARYLAQKEDSLWMQLRVQDSGIGIDPSHFDELFMPFNQLENSSLRQYGGSGLGLSICKRLVELMGGEIGLESRLGQGSTFFFNVPLTRAVHAGAYTALARGPESPALSFLMVEEGGGQTAQLQELLRPMGYPCVTIYQFENPLIERLQADEFRYVLFDWTCPERRGIDMVDCLRLFEDLESTPVVLVDALGRSQVVAKCQAQAYPLPIMLQLPTDTERLFEALGQMDFTHAFHARSTLKPFRVQHGHVLVAEDNKVNQMVIGDYLEGFGCRVTLVDNGAQAVQAVREAQSQPFMVILMDIQMPQMDGYEACRQIRALDAQVPIIALSAAVMPRDRQASMEAGMNGHLAKPIDPQALHQELSQYCKHKNATMVSKNVDGWNKARLLENLRSESLVNELLVIFMTQHRQDAQLLMDTHLDDQSVRAILHTLKGTCGDLQLTQLSAAAQTLLESAGALDAQALAALSSALENTCQQIEDFLGGNDVR
jgi:signal transduction histidine kinase/CheY-like chemotaxis protein